MAGEIVGVTVNLSALIAARYYDPASGTVKDAGSDVPMSRVYLVDGEATCKVWGGKKYEYKKTLTHETVKGTDGFPTITGEPYFDNPSDNLSAVELGRGYWIYLTGEGVLVP